MPLKAIHLVDEGVYLVDRPWSGQYEVGGLAAAPQGQLVVKSLDSVVHVETRQGELLNFKDESGEVMSAADYAAQRLELLKDSTVDDDGNREFKTLEAEFVYRKFADRWKAGDRAPNTVIRTPAEIEVTEVRVNSGDPDIVSLWNAPDLHQDVRLYSLNRDGVMVKAFHEQCREAGLTFENDSHPSYLRFAKIEGEYAFSDAFNQNKRPFTGTLAQCKAEKAHCIQRVTAVVSLRAAKKRGIQLQNAGTVLIALQGVQTNLAGVRARKDSDASLSGARKRLTSLIADIQKEIGVIQP
jgi:hypothetical protein